MFRAMRRTKQQIPQDECDKLLLSCSNGVLAVHGDDGFPYAVPMSYVYADNKIILHCAKSGHKIDAIRNNPKVSFCVVAQDNVVQETFSTDYLSVIVFGKAHILEDDEEKKEAIRKLADKYCADIPKERHEQEIRSDFPALCMVVIDIEHMTGKESKAMAKARVHQ